MAKFRLSGLINCKTTVEFDQEKVTVGRAQDNDFVINSTSVSRFQAEITVESAGYVLRNLGRFPTRLNKRPVDQCIIKCGDILTLGDQHFKFETIEPALTANEPLVHTEPPTDATVLLPAGNGSPADAGGHAKVSKLNNSENKENRKNHAKDNHFAATVAKITEFISTENTRQNIESDSDGQTDETLIDPVPALLKVVNGPDPGTHYLLDHPRFVVGRSTASDIVIDDRRVSRSHFAVEQRTTGYFLVRLTEHQTILVNSRPVNECRLFNNDLIEFFTLSFVFKSTNPADQQQTSSEPVELPNQFSLDETNLPDTTMLPSRVVVKKPGPRLVNHNKYGNSTVYQLNVGRTCIGRDSGCDAVIEGDKSVSRLHAVVEKQSKGHVISPESINPVLLNSKRIRRSTRIFSGDTLQLGDTLLTFLSEFKEDQPPAKKVMSQIILPITSVMSVILVGFLIYSLAWQPWRVEKQIDTAEQLVASSELAEGKALLAELYSQDLKPAQRSQVAQLLSESELALVSNDIERGALESARDILITFLRKYGAEEETAGPWHKLNEVRFLLARKYQAEGSVKAALQEYVRIDSDSELYNSAQKAISDIWFESQNEAQLQARAVDQNFDSLLAEAEELFNKKHFLTPKHNNAYAIYAQILASDETNTEALGKIEEMKAFYQSEGNRFCAEGKQALASTYFRRFLIIEPENKRIQQSLGNIANCHSAVEVASKTDADVNAQQAELNIGSSEKKLAAEASDPGRQIIAANSPNRQKIEKLLKKEGIESSWIIEYLFDESANGSESSDEGTPW